MQPGVPGGGIVRARRPTPRSGIDGALLPAEALAPVGGAVGANRTVPAGGAGCGGGSRPRAGPFGGGGVILARCSFRPSEGGGAQARRGGAHGRRDAAPSIPARTRQVGPVSRPRKRLRGVLCEEEQTPSERSPLGGSRNRSSRPWHLRPQAPGFRAGQLDDRRPPSYLRFPSKIGKAKFQPR